MSCLLTEGREKFKNHSTESRELGGIGFPQHFLCGLGRKVSVEAV